LIFGLYLISYYRVHLQLTFIVLSLEAVANQHISGCQSQAKMGPLWAVNWDKHLSGFLKSHSCTFPFSDTAENMCIWCGLNCTSRTLSVLLQNTNLFTKCNNKFKQVKNLAPSIELELNCMYLLPNKISGGLFDAQIEAFHGSILRAGNKPEGLRGVETDFVDRPPVVVENMVLLRPGRFVEIPQDHGSVRGRSRQNVVCKSQSTLRVTYIILKCAKLAIKSVPHDIVAGKVEINIFPDSQVAVFHEFFSLDVKHLKNWNEN